MSFLQKNIEKWRSWKMSSKIGAQIRKQQDEREVIFDFKSGILFFFLLPLHSPATVYGPMGSH